MTWGGRFKLIVGIIAVLIVVAGATLVFNQRQNRVDSVTATIGANSVGVGTDYGGLVVRAFVKEGDTVPVGAPLFKVQSLQLERDLATGTIESGRRDLAPDGTATISALTAGTVSALDVEQGSYAPAGSVLATIDASGSLYVDAEFVLSPLDFGRIDEGASADILLPDQRTLHGTVEKITVSTEDGDAATTVRVRSADLVDGESNGLVMPGTPVEVALHLRDDGPLAGPSDAVRNFMHRIGL